MLLILRKMQEKGCGRKDGGILSNMMDLSGPFFIDIITRTRMSTSASDKSSNAKMILKSCILKEGIPS